MSGVRNPWNDGLMTVAILLAGLGGLFVIGLLVAVAFGADLSGGPEIGARYVAFSLLMVIFVMAFVVVMAARWDRRHKS